MLRESTRLCSAGCWLLEDDQKGLGCLSPAPQVTDSIDWGFNGSLGTQTHTKPSPVALLLDRSSLLQCKKCLFFSLNRLQSALGLLCSSKFFDLCCLGLGFFLPLSLRYQMELSNPKISPCAASDSGNFTTCESAGASEPQLLLAANTGAVSAGAPRDDSPAFPGEQHGISLPQVRCETTVPMYSLRMRFPAAEAQTPPHTVRSAATTIPLPAPSRPVSPFPNAFHNLLLPSPKRICFFGSKPKSCSILNKGNLVFHLKTPLLWLGAWKEPEDFSL